LSLIFSLFCTAYSEFTFLLPLPFQHTQVAMEVTDMWPKECPFSLTTNCWHGMVCETWRIYRWNLLHYIPSYRLPHYTTSSLTEQYETWTCGNNTS